MHDDTTDEMAADADLVLRTRSGDAEAFGELWRRHYPSGMAVARSITSTIDADDLVQESYARIYQAILKGGGPNGSFRAYLFTSIRNTAAAWGRARRETTIDELETVVDPASTDQATEEALDRGLTAQAFRSLPSRWQEVLWYSEIEQMKPGEIAPLLGMKAGAVSQLAFRAREGLREAWIQAHLRSAEPGSDCQWTIEHLGAYSRGNLGVRDRKRLEAHLDDCARCMIVAAEAKDVSGRLALVLLPLVLGVAGAGAYLASLQGGGTPIVALAAMPSEVIEGAVVVGGAAAGAGAAGTGQSAGAGGAGGAGAGGGAGASGGAITGVGALVGAGSAALLVAGVVAAVAVVPSMMNASSATSPPSASDDDPSSISSEVSPDSSVLDQNPVVIEVDDEQDAPKADAPPAKNPDASPEAPATPSPAPSETPTTEPTPAVPAIPTPPAGPTDPETTDPGTDPGTDPTDPETDPTDPGTDPTDPGTDPTDPGTDPTDPETDPETDPTDPGTDPTDPGTDPTDPGTDPGTEVPVAITHGDRSIWWEGLKVHYSIPVHGTPNATVEAWMGGSAAGGDRIVLDAQGNGLIDLRPDGPQYALGTTLGLRYVTDGTEGDWTYSRLRSGILDRSSASSDAPSPAASAQSAPAAAPVQAPASDALSSDPSAPESTAPSRDDAAPAADASTETAASSGAPASDSPAAQDEPAESPAQQQAESAAPTTERTSAAESSPDDAPLG